MWYLLNKRATPSCLLHNIKWKKKAGRGSGLPETNSVETQGAKLAYIAWVE